MVSRKKFIDIAANLPDTMFKGIYNGKHLHEADLDSVLERASNVGVDKIIITGTDLSDSEVALQIASGIHNGSSLGSQKPALFTTVGCHPTRCNDIEKNGNPEAYLNNLMKLAETNKEKVVAIGECGLDYDRLHFCDKNKQKKYFEKQLEISKKVNLPLFLHCRNASDDFLSIIEKHKNLVGGVVHSFDGTEDTMSKLTELGFYIGINDDRQFTIYLLTNFSHKKYILYAVLEQMGITKVVTTDAELLTCSVSLKTEDNLNVARKIPKDKLMIETDCPWCEVRPSHAGERYVKSYFGKFKKEKWQPSCMVKGRNEPCTIVQILDILSAIRNEDADDLSEQIYKNTEQLFFKS